jgi:DNA-directed RNA polymerase subunit RPC12/RpoP
MHEFVCQKCKALLGIFPKDASVKCTCGMEYEIDWSQSPPNATYLSEKAKYDPNEEQIPDQNRTFAQSNEVAQNYAIPEFNKIRKDAQIICPQCQTRGFVRTQQVKMKKGISGGKATAAVFTLGFSMLATGLSRMETLTEARCNKCGSVWHF